MSEVNYKKIPCYSVRCAALYNWPQARVMSEVNYKKIPCNSVRRVALNNWPQARVMLEVTYKKIPCNGVNRTTLNNWPQARVMSEINYKKSHATTLDVWFYATGPWIVHIIQVFHPSRQILKFVRRLHFMAGHVTSHFLWGGKLMVRLAIYFGFEYSYVRV